MILITEGGSRNLPIETAMGAIHATPSSRWSNQVAIHTWIRLAQNSCISLNPFMILSTSVLMSVTAAELSSAVRLMSVVLRYILVTREPRMMVTKR
jgi:hypothetical protein